MAKILQGNHPKRINAVVDKKALAWVVFDDNGIYETNDERVIKALKNYGYEVMEKPKKKEKELE